MSEEVVPFWSCDFNVVEERSSYPSFLRRKGHIIHKCSWDSQTRNIIYHWDEMNNVLCRYSLVRRSCYYSLLLQTRYMAKKRFSQPFFPVRRSTLSILFGGLSVSWVRTHQKMFIAQNETYCIGLKLWTVNDEDFDFLDHNERSLLRSAT